VKKKENNERGVENRQKLPKYEPPKIKEYIEAAKISQ